jgi:hypothetical protein
MEPSERDGKQASRSQAVKPQSAKPQGNQASRSQSATAAKPRNGKAWSGSPGWGNAIRTSPGRDGTRIVEDTQPRRLRNSVPSVAGLGFFPGSLSRHCRAGLSPIAASRLVHHFLPRARWRWSSSEYSTVSMAMRVRNSAPPCSTAVEFVTASLRWGRTLPVLVWVASRPHFAEAVSIFFSRLQQPVLQFLSHFAPQLAVLSFMQSLQQFLSPLIQALA